MADFYFRPSPLWGFRRRRNGYGVDETARRDGGLAKRRVSICARGERGKSLALFCRRSDFVNTKGVKGILAGRHEKKG